MEVFKSWQLWLFILLLILLIFWFTIGRKSPKTQFVGIQPLINSGDQVKPYVYSTYTPPPPPEKRNFKSRGEEICCQVMEKVYGLPFSSVRLSCLRNPESGCNLEIDVYNEELKIGVEYNGEQHYVFPNKFHKTKEEFIAQVRRDQYKVETCDKEGIYLITVPYNVSLDKIEEYILMNLPEPCKI